MALDKRAGSAMTAGDVLDKQLRPSSAGAPLIYRGIRLLFKNVTRVFYKRIEVENIAYLPPDGVPTILCANHSNSLTDATLLIGNIPSSSRTLLRLTAKDSHFRRRGLSSWLIEGAGALPIMRAQDHVGVQTIELENKKTFSKLVESLQQGDCIGLFPEGISRYYPTIAPLKTGVSRIASQYLGSVGDDAVLHIVTASIVYTAREKFRSNVLISFSKPIAVSRKTHPDLVLVDSQSEEQRSTTHKAIKQLTDDISNNIKSKLLDAPSWKILKTAQTARRLYAPASGQELSLALYVQLTQAWVEIMASTEKETAEIGTRLRAYERKLQKLGLKDQRVIIHTQLPTIVLLRRLFTRLAIACALSILASPAIFCWTPTLIFVKLKERAFKHNSREKPTWDVWDEIAQTKLIYGLVALVLSWIVLVAISWPFVAITIWAVPLWMLFGLRAWEKLIASIRGFLALARVLRLHNTGSGRGLLELVNERATLQKEVLQLATQHKLPEDYREWIDQHKAPKRPTSLRRRVSSMAFSGKVQDWSSSIRLWDDLDADSDDEEGELTL